MLVGQWGNFGDHGNRMIFALSKLLVVLIKKLLGVGCSH